MSLLDPMVLVVVTSYGIVEIGPMCGYPIYALGPGHPGQMAICSTNWANVSVLVFDPLFSPPPLFIFGDPRPASIHKPTVIPSRDIPLPLAQVE